MIGFKTFITLIFAKVLQFVAFIFPKKKQRILIGTKYGKFYNDNPKYFYEFLKTKSDYEVCIISKSKKLTTNNSNVDYSFSWKALKYYLTSKTIILTGGNIDIFPFKPAKNQLIINLWHGTPLKKIGFYIPENKDKKFSFEYIVSSSEIESEVFSKAFGISKERVICAGIPRNSILSKNNYSSDEIETLLYIPTFRESRETIYFPFKDFSLEKLASFLEKNKLNLMIKPHNNDINNNEELQSIVKLNNVKLLTDEKNDLQEVLLQTDLLITDYSGVYFDYLLLNRPMMFIPYDLEKYSKERGFLFDYEETTPGPKILSYKEFEENIETFRLGKDNYIEERLNVRKKFHRYEDGKNSDRILKFINHKLN